MKLNVAISTYGSAGIKRVEKMLHNIQPQNNVKYVVSWQDHFGHAISDYLIKREDVEIYRFDKKGLSNNRNNSIKYCDGDIILIADDDVIYDLDFADKIIKTFESNEKYDLLIFKIDNLKKKEYPAHDVKLTLPLPKNYYCSSIEIAFRKENLGDLKFWPGMGLGNNYLHCGEDEIFLLSAIKRGKQCYYINKKIGEHPDITTGDKVSPGILRGQGFVIQAIYPVTSFFRIILKAYRIKKKNAISFLFVLKQLSKGAYYKILNWKKIPMCYRW